MRIISGEVGGRKIKGGRKELLRPTSDRVKEALFNILGKQIKGSGVLDLYAGSGNLGLEALSRGAREVTFIDLNTESVRLIKENLKILGYSLKSKVIKGDAISYLLLFEKKGITFDFIFADPPYHTKFILPDQGSRFPLSTDGIFVLQHHKKISPELSQEYSIKKSDERKFGETVLTFYEKYEIKK
jgi:16S rRNA (guanine(966)-N(2))-methyltransferase RsmD